MLSSKFFLGNLVTRLHLLQTILVEEDCEHNLTTVSCAIALKAGWNTTLSTGLEFAVSIMGKVNGSTWRESTRIVLLL
jgi:hypothetical protein